MGHLSAVPSRPALTLTRHRTEEAEVLVLSGGLDIDGVGQVQALLHDPALRSSQGLVVDLTGLRFIDSSGLGVLVRARRWASAAGLRMVVVVVPASSLERIVQLSGLDQVFTLAETVDLALALLRGPGRAT